MANNPIDKLEIEVSANAQKASQTLADLIKQIDGLSDSLRNFDASKMISQLGLIGKSFKGINAGNLTKQINALNAALAKYGTNIQKVSRTGTSSNTALYHLSKSTGELSRGLDSVNGKVNNFIAKFKKAEKVTKNFAQTAGLLYARFFLLIRGVKSLTNMVKSSMDYIEVMNYYSNSFDRIAKDSVNGWEEAGYDSADAYYESFTNRAEQVTRDMSGYFTNDKGLLQSTGLKSLGLNPSEVIQYQTQFAQISNSMGATGEQSLKLSEVLTKLGGDLASIKNMEFQDVWEDMTSGLIGQSRAWYKYGANIREANMQEKLAELGINATVNSLSQGDKALLRTIILLDASKGAWGDLAKTLNTPANQFRLLANNIKILGQMIGQILLPIVAKVLPYLNAFVLVLQRLFGWLAKIFKIDLSDLAPENSGLGNNEALGDLLDNADDLGDALGKDNNEAKKLKKTIMGFDELNVLNDKDDKDKGTGITSGLASGLLNDAFFDAVDDYLKAWQDAFNKLGDEASRIADKIQTFFTNITAPIRRAWAEVGDFVKESWAGAIEKIKGLFESLKISFWRVWGESDTQKIFENIFYIVGDIGLVVGELADKFRIAWDENLNGYHILADIRDIILIITDHFKNMADATVEWAKNLDLVPLFTKFEEFLSSIEPVVDAVYGTLEDFYTNVILPLGEWVLEQGLPDLLQVLIDFNEKVDWDGLRSKLKTLWEHLEPFAEKVGEGFIIFVERVSDALADFLNGDNLTNFLEKVEKWMDKTSAEDIADFFEKLVKGIIALKVATAGFKVAKGMGDVVVWLSNLKNVFAGGEIASGTKELSGLSKVVKSFSGGTGLKSTFEAMKFAGNSANLSTIFGAGSVAEVGATIGLWLGGSILAAIGGFELGKKIGKAITEAFGGDGSVYDNFTWFQEGGFFDSLKYFCTEMIPEAFHEAGESISQWATDTKESLSQWASEAQASFQTWKENAMATITEWADATKDKVEVGKQMFEDWKNSTKDIISTWYKDHVAPVFDKQKWTEMYAVVKDKLTEKWQGLKDWWSTNGASVWFQNNVAPAFKKETWASTYDVVKSQLVEKWNSATDEWKRKFSDWWQNSVVKNFEKSKWADALKGIEPAFQEKFKSAFDKVSEIAKGMYESVVGWVEKLVDKVSDLISKIKEAKDAESGASRFFSFGLGLSSGIKIPTFKAFANGGFPEDGFFYANHSEMVGGFSNGKTAVANNEQITTGIRNAVYDAMMSVMSTSNGFGGDIVVNAVLKTEDDEVLARAVTRGQQQMTRRYSPSY